MAGNGDDTIAATRIAGLDEVLRGGFPANRISEIKGVIDPTTAEAR